MQHLLSLADVSAEDIHALLDEALTLKQSFLKGGNAPLLAGKTLALLFMKPSLRTRVSFELAIHQLGGYSLYLSPPEVGLGTREAVQDVARVLGGYVDGIMARVFDHAHIVTLAQYSPVPVINGLSDYDHPCQALADMLTLREHFGSLEGLKLAYVGDSNNVARALLFITSLLRLPLALASPEGYSMDAASLARAQALAGGKTTFSLTTDPRQAVQGAQVVYTDTWTSMGQEAETEARRRVFPPYQVNAELLRHASAEAVVLHCLPAHRGEEITDEVADGPASLLFQQANNRLHAQKAVLARLLGGRSIQK